MAVKSKLTQALATITKKVKWPEDKKVGFHDAVKGQKFFNPVLTPPPRSPNSPEDFRHPHRLGHWRSFGFDYTSPVADKYYYHEACAIFFIFGGFTIYFWSYGPDWKLRDWAKREAFLRTHKREALGLPLIDRNVVDPERVVLPTEEELEDFPVTM